MKTGKVGTGDTTQVVHAGVVTGAGFLVVTGVTQVLQAVIVVVTSG
jgi:hypothetical protein